MTSQAYDDGYYLGFNGLAFDSGDKQGQELTDCENGFNDGDDDRIAIQSATKFDQPLELPEDYRF